MQNPLRVVPAVRPKSIVETPAKTTKHGDNVKSESAEKPPTKDSQLPAAEMARDSDKKRIFEEPG